MQILKRTLLLPLIACSACAGLPSDPLGLNTPPAAAPANAGSEASQCSDSLRAIGRLKMQTPAKPGGPAVDTLYWCTKAAEKGDVRSQYILAGLYERGVGVPVSLTDALRWYRAAADSGYAEAQFKVGQFYGRGQGVVQDRNEATRWYMKAAGQGLPDAQYYMGYRYEHGKGIAQSYTEAARWYLKAAEQGNVSAMDGLGGLSLAGHGMPQNQLEAYKWFNLAAVSGAPEFVANRDRVAAGLTPAQLAEGQRLASEWAKHHPIGKAPTP